ncbi:hypothetical protein D917_02301 [Trichinella nativa]|uniref:Uncharacterized protein n=1 Tax=Trichinella nativa TaxID=6335 RepID=A0A1Y3EG88_9BILA|nr:hypothetical protein D917_02301 [Trichinella nativa]
MSMGNHILTITACKNAFSFDRRAIDCSTLNDEKQVDEEANSCYFAYGIRCLRQLTTASRRRNLEFRLFNKEPTTN